MNDFQWHTGMSDAEYQRRSIQNDWKSASEFAPYHPQASHIDPSYRDGWNRCYAEAQKHIAQLNTERDTARAELVAARQSLWDVYAAIGCDTDGDPTPAAVIGDLGKLVVDAAKESRADYDEALDSCMKTETELAELRKTLEANQQDAYRYRHVRLTKLSPDDFDAECDAAIDAADAASGKGSEHG